MSLGQVVQIALAAIISAGGIGGIIIAVVRFSSDLIAERMSKKFEASLNKELEKYKIELRKKEYISKTRFDREFTMYQELSEKNITMVYDMGTAVLIARGALNGNLLEVDSFLERAANSLNDAEMTNKRFAPFISKDIFEKYKELGKYGSSIFKLLRVWKDYNTNPNFQFKTGDLLITSQQQATQEIERIQKQLSSLSDQILDELRAYLSRIDTLEDTNHG